MKDAIRKQNYQPRRPSYFISKTPEQEALKMDKTKRQRENRIMSIQDCFSMQRRFFIIVGTKIWNFVGKTALRQVLVGFFLVQFLTSPPRLFWMPFYLILTVWTPYHYKNAWWPSRTSPLNPILEAFKRYLQVTCIKIWI